jgi:hypothetical protein
MLHAVCRMLRAVCCVLNAAWSISYVEYVRKHQKVASHGSMHRSSSPSARARCAHPPRPPLRHLSLHRSGRGVVHGVYACLLHILCCMLYAWLFAAHCALRVDRFTWAASRCTPHTVACTPLPPGCLSAQWSSPHVRDIVSMCIL